MGQLTLSSIVSQGLAKASRSDLTTFATTQLNAWLKQRAGDWPWPQLVRRITNVALASGATSISFGNGASGVTEEVQNIIDPVLIFTSDFKSKGKVRVQKLIDVPLHIDESVNDPALNKGIPQLIKIRADATLGGKWTLIPYPIPDRAYLLAVDYLTMPGDYTSGQKPWYPGDATMIQQVKCEALDYSQRYDELSAEREVLAAMVGDDRYRFGQQEGWQSSIEMDQRYHRAGGAVGYGWPPK